MKIVPVILCGGMGSRLWPLSRSTFPKPFAPILGLESLFQTTLKRNAIFYHEPIIVCGEQHRFLVKDQLKSLSILPSGIILEPTSRNTAPAAALAALFALNENPLLLITPADHLIQNEETYQKAVLSAAPYADEGGIAVFGCFPTAPHTGYGYIQTGNKLDTNLFEVSHFIEKPSEIIAKKLIREGNNYWNSGIFLCRASVYLQLLKTFSPEIYRVCQKAANHSVTDNRFVCPGKEFKACKEDSIDYAIMEKASNRAMVSLEAGWSDVGSWSTVSSIANSSGDIYLDATQNTYVNASNRFVAAIGVKDLAIIETRDAVLVLDKKSDQKVKDLVKHLKQSKRSEALLPSKVKRPWGAYEILEKSPGFQVKRITVKPGAALSLQLHYHRSEHWIIVKGAATITRDNETFKLMENQSTYIPAMTKHRLANYGKEPLDLIEVQCGTYLGEDDIVRFEDQYGRQRVALGID